MATFQNQATLSYNGVTTNSNVTTGELLIGLSATKSALSSEYTAGGTVVYTVSIVNSGVSAVDGLTLVDNLGAYTVSDGTAVYPLDYVDGTLRLYVNGVLSETPAVSANPELTVSGINIPAGANALVVYEATPNEFAPLYNGGTITNVASVSGATLAETITVSDTVSARSEAALTIAKAICPDTVTDNGVLTYTFVIQNSGAEAADADAEIVITDTFNPTLSDITVTIDGSPLPASAYTYDEASGVFATVAGAIIVPGATFMQNAQTGAFTVTPGVTVIKISGTV